MKISGLSETGIQAGQMGAGQATDSVSKNIQKQIADTQKQLQELSSNSEMSIEEKMKKRQEIQKQISDLNNQLRQHEMELRKGKQEAKGNTMEDMLGGSRKASASKTGSQSTGLSQASMKAIISADSAVSQAQVQGSVSAKMEGKAGTLESEIKLDGARGGDTTKKEEELAKVEQTAMNAAAAQMNTLGEARKEIEQAAKADEKANSTNGANNISTKDKDKDEKTTDKTTDTKDADAVDSAAAENNSEAVVSETAAAGVQNTVYYTPVDVRL